MNTFSGSSPHQPLSNTDPSEIRIIKLFPGNFDDEIHCELEHMSLELADSLPFAAISSCWEDPEATESIFLDRQRYPVTENLYAFLQHARSILSAIAKTFPRILRLGRQESVLLTQHIVYSILQDFDFPVDFPSSSDSTLPDLVERHARKLLGEIYEAQGTEQQHFSPQFLSVSQILSEPHEAGSFHLRLWIDALCINQKDLDERNSQIRYVKQIYTKSKQTLIWLGVSSDDPAFKRNKTKILLWNSTHEQQFKEHLTYASNLDKFEIIRPNLASQAHLVFDFLQRVADSGYHRHSLFWMTDQLLAHSWTVWSPRQDVQN